jgi:thymidine phosphorylase
MSKIKVVLDCKLGKNVAGDTVLLDEKLAKSLIKLGRATPIKEEPKKPKGSK